MPVFWKRYLARCGGRHDVGEICTSISAMTTETSEMYAMHLELPDAARADVITLLRARLGNAVDLADRIRQAYWGMCVHCTSKRREMFEAFHDEIDECIDTLSRRIAFLSGVTERSVRVAALERSPGRYPLNMPTGEDREKIVRLVLARFFKRVRADVDRAAEIGDAGTADVLSDISRRLETQLWIVGAQLF
jgi:starvation-inducible DNA-binding protein